MEATGTGGKDAGSVKRKYCMKGLCSIENFEAEFFTIQ